MQRKKRRCRFRIRIRHPSWFVKLFPWIAVCDRRLSDLSASRWSLDVRSVQPRGGQIVHRSSSSERRVRGRVASPGRCLTFPWPAAILSTVFWDGLRSLDRHRQHCSAAASSRSSTGRSASGRSGTGRSTSSWSGAGRSAARVAAALANFAAADLGAVQLWHLEAAGLLAAAVATIVAAGRSWCTAGRSGSRRTSDGSGTRRSTSGSTRGGSSAAWGTRGRSRTRWGWGSAGRWRTAASRATVVVEQAGIGAVDAGKTNQRGGNPCEFHLVSPTEAGPWNVRDSRALFQTPCLVASTCPWTQGCITALSFRTRRAIPVSQTNSI